MSNTIPNRQNWFLDNTSYELDKSDLVNQYILYMLCRSVNMFDYEGLPDTIPKKDLEIINQMGAIATILKVDDKLYAVNAQTGSEFNPYYRSISRVVANPYLPNTKATEYIDGVDCIMIHNDSCDIGLLPMARKYSIMLAESDLSLVTSIINNRIPKLLSTTDDETKKAFDIYMDKVLKGKVAILLNDDMEKSIHADDYSFNANIKDNIEIRNYIESCYFIELGLSTNWNAKRESINESEASMDDDILIPLCDDMLKNRQEGWDKVNKLFGTNVKVTFGSAWKKCRDEIKLKMEALKEGDNDEVEGNESESTDNGVDIPNDSKES